MIVFAYGVSAEYPLILAANRDEFYERPTQAASFWTDEPDIYAGRDLQGGGTWLGVTRGGRFAAVTNYRDPTAPAGTRSRGELVAAFLRTGDPPQEYLDALVRRAGDFSGFNLIVGEMNSASQQVGYYSNRGTAPLLLTPGIYGLSNHLLDTPWPKVTAGKNALRSLLAAPSFDRERIFDILADRTLAADGDLPSTGVSFEVEKAISAIFIDRPGYGTRCSTVLTFDNEMTWELDERTWV